MKRTLILLGVALLSSGISAQSVFRKGAVHPKLEMTKTLPPEEMPVCQDNTRSKYFPDIIDQYGGSCAQASGIHYVFTYEMNRWLDRTAKGHSENTFSYRWIWHLLNGGSDQGSIAEDGLEIVKKAGCVTVRDYGADEGSDYNYRWPNGYSRYYNGMPYKVKSIKEIDISSEEGIQTLCNYFIDENDGHEGGGIASFSLTGDNWGYEPYDGPSSCELDHTINLKGVGGAHAMTLAGYDQAFEKDFDGNGEITDDEKGAFILVNSWGTWWGHEGKAYMPFYYFRHDSENGGVSSWDALAMIVDVEYREPSICMEVNLDYTSRNDLIFRFGVSDGAQATKPDRHGIMSYPYPSGQGGDQPMQGTMFASARTIGMGFDISELEEYASTLKAPCWFLSVNKTVLGKSGSGHVNYIRVHDYRNGAEQVYSSDPDEKTGIKVGLNYVKLPTREWFKNENEDWYMYSTTSANPAFVPEKYTVSADYDSPMAIRTADMDYAKVRITKVGTNGEIKLEVVRYE